MKKYRNDIGQFLSEAWFDKMFVVTHAAVNMANTLMCEQKIKTPSGDIFLDAWLYLDTLDKKEENCSNSKNCFARIAYRDFRGTCIARGEEVYAKTLDEAMEAYNLYSKKIKEMEETEEEAQ